MTLEELNAMSRKNAERELLRCCGSARWAAAVAARRPFADAAQLYRVADEVWWSLDGGDWLEAFSHHPRIGERAAGWAQDEQSGVRSADADVVKKLADRNREYERKFGHVFLVFATGKQAHELLGELERRIGNDAAAELRAAAGEQAKITRLRLEKLLSPSRASTRTA